MGDSTEDLTLKSEDISLSPFARLKQTTYNANARPAGMAIRALSWLGPEQASSALKMLHTKLAPAEWAAMRSARAVLPSWMARAVSEVSEHA